MTQLIELSDKQINAIELGEEVAKMMLAIKDCSIRNSAIEIAKAICACDIQQDQQQQMEQFKKIRKVVRNTLKNNDE